MAEKKITVKDVEKCFKSEKVTMEELQKGVELAKELAQADYKRDDDDWTESRVARIIVGNKFMEYLEDESNEVFLEESFKSVFVDGRKFNAHISTLNEETGEFEKVLNLRVSMKTMKKLLQDHNFYLQE